MKPASQISKSEALNPKQIKNPNLEMSKTTRVSDFWTFVWGFVSDFWLRILSFVTVLRRISVMTN